MGVFPHFGFLLDHICWTRRGKMMKKILSLALGLSLITVPASAQPTFPGDNGLLAFVSFTSGSPVLWTAEVDGSVLTKIDDLSSPLTGYWCGAISSGTSSAPAWSPDGTSIAYASNGYMWVARNGELPQQITGVQAEAVGLPSWSYDGSKIAVILDYVLTVVDIGTGAVTEIEAPYPNWFDDFARPSWSPDGTEIAVAYSNSRISPDVVVVAADGSAQAAITDDGVSGQPAWSPDGAFIAFASSGGINTARPDGSDRTVVVDTGPNGNFPKWSPDGTRLLFWRYDGATFTNEVSITDGVSVQSIPAPPGGWVCDPVWSPDGNQILFHDLSNDLWTIDSDLSAAADPIGIKGQHLSWGPRPVEPVDIGILIDDVNNLDIQKGKKNSLLSTLKKAQDLLADSNPDNDGAVCDKLVAFEGKVADLNSEGLLDTEEADRLIASAQTIRGDIGCND